MSKPTKLIYELEVDQNGIYDTPRSFNRDVAFSFAGKTMVWTAEEKKRRTTINQRGYYRGVIIPEITEQLQNAGWQIDEKEVHGYMGSMYLKAEKRNQDTGEILFEYIRSTTDLFTFEMSLFMEACIQWCAENLGHPIPKAHSQTTYAQPEVQRELESREKYLTRIFKYLSEIQDIKLLRRYFEYYPNWRNEPDVRQLFNERKAILSSV